VLSLVSHSHRDNQAVLMLRRSLGICEEDVGNEGHAAGPYAFSPFLAQEDSRGFMTPFSVFMS